jgi:hypothetical protein
MILELLDPIIEPISSLCINHHTIINVFDGGDFDEVTQERFLLDPSSLVSVVVGGLGGFHETEQRFLVVSESFGVLGCCPDLEGKSWV